MKSSGGLDSAATTIQVLFTFKSKIWKFNQNKLLFPKKDKKTFKRNQNLLDILIEAIKEFNENIKGTQRRNVLQKARPTENTKEITEKHMYCSSPICLKHPFGCVSFFVFTNHVTRLCSATEKTVAFEAA